MRIRSVLFCGLVISLIGPLNLGSNPAWAIGGHFFKKDKTVCYQLRGSLYSRGLNFLRLNVKEHSPLNTYKEIRKLKHPRQTTYSVIGKKVTRNIRRATEEAISPDQLLFQMASTNGSAVVADRYGARLALTIVDLLTSQQTLSAESLTIGGPVQYLECASEESSATPEVWSQCAMSGLFDVAATSEEQIAPALQLVRVDPLENPLCSSFKAFPGDRPTNPE